MTVINTNSPTTSAAETPQPAPSLTPEAAIGQIRTLRSQLPAVTALTSKERRALRVSRTNSEPIVQASLNVIGVSDNVSAALGQPIDTVRALQQEAIIWKAAEDEVRNLLAGIAGANAIRRQKLAQLGAKAYAIGTQLAGDPENEVLVPHVEEIKRLKRIARRKKTASATPNQPSPSPSTPAPGAPHVETKQ
jgi:hypothetical protein